MTFRILLAAALLAPAAVSAQGWGAGGTDPNQPAASAAPAAKSAPARAKAKPAAKAAASEGSDLDDAALDRGRALVDRQLASRKASLAAQTQRLEGYHLAMEKDSVDAERQMADERKAFLLYLKSVPQEDRAEAMKRFEERQEGKRKELDKRHLSQYKAWFDENIESNWRTQALAAESVALPEAPVAAAAEPASAPEVAAGAPASAKAPAVRAKAKKRKKMR
jgi:hypothetical protein